MEHQRTVGHRHKFRLSESRVVEYGHLYRDTLNPGIAIEMFRFQGTAGDKVTLRSTGASAAIFDASYTVIAKSGTFSGRPMSTGNIDTLTLPATGTYLIQISASRYSFILYSQQKQMTGSPVIQYGQTYTDTIDPVEEIPTYLFQSTAGDKINLILSAGPSSALTAVQGFDKSAVDAYCPPCKSQSECKSL